MIRIFIVLLASYFALLRAIGDSLPNHGDAVDGLRTLGYEHLTRCTKVSGCSKRSLRNDALASHIAVVATMVFTGQPAFR